LAEEDEAMIKCEICETQIHGRPNTIRANAYPGVSVVSCDDCEGQAKRYFAHLLARAKETSSAAEIKTKDQIIAQSKRTACVARSCYV
jgi:ribosome-binding protein aMBF1 (putative translation factor)